MSFEVDATKSELSVRGARDMGWQKSVTKGGEWQEEQEGEREIEGGRMRRENRVRREVEGIKKG